MPTIITGEVYRDPSGNWPLVTPIGPFPGSTEARIFMEALLPLWGEWGIENLASTDLAHYGITPTSSDSGSAS